MKSDARLDDKRRGTVAAIVLAVVVMIAVPLVALGTGWPPPRRTAAPAAVPSYGVNLGYARLDDPDLEQALDRIEAMGEGGWVRLRFAWADIEAQQGRFDWAESDRLMAALRGRPLSVLAVLETSPAWARGEGDGEHRHAPPHERRHYGRFVGAFATRYADTVDAYQIWDEPNIFPHWGGRYADPAGYVALLREGAIQVRENDPTAWVLAGGLAPNAEPGGLNLSDVEYLRGMYAAGAAEWFDALAAKPYGLRASPDAPPDPAELNFQRVALLHEVMAEAGDGAKPIWGVEFGWNSLPSDWAGDPSPWGSARDETQQVEWTARAVEIARAEWPWMGPLLWAEWQPDAGLRDPRWGFAMLDPQGKPRAILRDADAWTLRASMAGAGTHGFASDAVTLEGAWRVSDAGADIGAQGSAMVIRFEGTGLDLTVRRGDYWAYLDITIDGEPANRLPRDEDGHSYLVLYDPNFGMATVPVASGLAEGEHAARLVAHGGWDQWALHSFTVHRSAASGPGRGGLGLIALAGAGSLLGATWLGTRRKSLRQVWVVRTLRGLVAWWQGRSMSVRLGALGVAGVSFFFVPFSPVAALGLLVTAGLLVLWPAGGLILVPALIPFFERPPALFGRMVPGLEMLVWLTALAWMANGWLEGRGLTDSLRHLWATRNELDLGAVALLGVSALSAALAANPGAALFDWRRVILASVLLYFLWRLVPAGGRDAKEIHRCMGLAVDALIVGAAAIALVGIAQRILSVNLITAEGVSRIRALYGSPNNLSLYLGRVLPIVLAMAAFGGSSRRRMAYALVAVPIAIALYLTYSRGAWLLGMPAALLVMGVVRGGKWRLASVLLVIVALAALIPLAGTERMSSLLDPGSGTAVMRLKLWRSAWSMWLDHPWLGVGPDNFLYAYRTHYILPSAWQEPNLSHPHNVLFDALTRVGVFGALALGVVVVGVTRRLWAVARRGSARVMPGVAKNVEILDTHNALAIGLLGSMAAFLAHGLIDNSFFLADLALVFMMTAGLAACWADGHIRPKVEE